MGETGLTRHTDIPSPNPGSTGGCGPHVSVDNPRVESRREIPFHLSLFEPRGENP